VLNSTSGLGNHSLSILTDPSIRLRSVYNKILPRVLRDTRVSWLKILHSFVMFHNCALVKFNPDNVCLEINLAILYYDVVFMFTLADLRWIWFPVFKAVLHKSSCVQRTTVWVLLDTVWYYVISNIAAVLAIDILVQVAVAQADIFFFSILR